MEWLADPAREGRGTGEAGAQASAEWIAKYLTDSALQPVNNSFFQSFNFNAGVKLVADKNRFEIVGDSARFETDRDFRPLPYSDNGEAQGEMFFWDTALSHRKNTARADTTATTALM